MMMQAPLDPLDQAAQQKKPTAVLPKTGVPTMPTAQPMVSPVAPKPPAPGGGVTMMPPPAPIPASNFTPTPGTTSVPLPPPIPAPSAAGLPTAPTSTFGPGHDLRSTQINPVADPRLATTQGQVNTAAGQVANGPDRLKLAQDYFSSLVSSSQPDFEKQLRSITQRAAAGGRTGSGMYGSDLLDAGQARQNALAREAAGLAYDAGSATVGDRLSGLSALSGLEGQLYGQGAAGRDEYRTERDYQTGQANSAIDRATEQRLLEEYLLNQAFNRNRATTGDLASIGFGG